jgi:protein required for attachment to host cells
MNKLIVLANKSRVRVLRFEEAGDDPQQQDHLREESGEIREPVQPIREIVTDQQGRWGKAMNAGIGNGMSTGEEHNLELEEEKRAVERIAARVNQAVKRAGTPNWTLAATRPFAAQLKSALALEVASRLTETIDGDLTKVPLDELERRLLMKV